MPRDFNHVVLTGEVCTDPSLITLKSRKRLCIFSIKNIERFVLGNGEPAQHDNVFVVEVIGGRADQCAQDVRRGERYAVTGYLRADDIDGVERIRVRAFNIQKE